MIRRLLAARRTEAALERTRAELRTARAELAEAGEQLAIARRKVHDQGVTIAHLKGAVSDKRRDSLAARARVAHEATVAPSLPEPLATAHRRGGN